MAHNLRARPDIRQTGRRSPNDFISCCYERGLPGASVLATSKLVRYPMVKNRCLVECASKLVYE